jgi:hypothetical protein
MQWIMRPVISKHIQLYQLYDGTYDLGQIADLIEAMDVAAENEWRVNDAVNKQNRY